MRVLDFGLSLVSRQTVEDLTQTTTGAFAYMAPELLQGRRAHRGSDLYAAGVIAYEMFTGRFPYDESNIGVLAAEILNKAVVLDQVEGGLRAVLERLLAKNAIGAPPGLLRECPFGVRLAPSRNSLVENGSTWLKLFP